MVSLNKFTHRLFSSLLSSALALAFASCSTIDESERFIYVPPVASTRAVLIEDFTGQRCINCPNAALEIEKLKEQYGADTIIAVGIHSGPLAVYSRGNILGLRTEEGDTYYDHWKIEQEPMGYINRRGEIATVDRWATMVREAIQVPTDISIQLDPYYDSDDNKLHVGLTVIVGEPFDGHLQLWVTESNITALQMMPDGSANPTYVHNHVFRRSVNGTWGTPFTAAQGQIQTLDFECDFDPAWQLDNLSIVGFLYNNDGVQQVVECPANPYQAEPTDN